MTRAIVAPAALPPPVLLLSGAGRRGASGSREITRVVRTRSDTGPTGQVYADYRWGPTAMPAHVSQGELNTLLRRQWQRPPVARTRPRGGYRRAVTAGVEPGMVTLSPRTSSSSCAEASHSVLPRRLEPTPVLRRLDPRIGVPSIVLDSGELQDWLDEG